MRLDPVYVHARRETIVIVAICLAMGLWSLVTASALGFGPLPVETIRDSQVAGFPTWVLWSLVIPWCVATLLTGWFCFFYLADDPLSDQAEETLVAASHDPTKAVSQDRDQRGGYQSNVEERS